MKSNKIRNRIILVCVVLLVVVAVAFIPKKNKMMGRPAGEPGMGGAANETVYSVTSQTVEKTELQYSWWPCWASSCILDHGEYHSECCKAW